MATTKELIEQYKQKREKIKEMGGAEAIEKLHKGGQWTTRERLDYFFDAGTFTEIGLFVKHRTTDFGLDKIEIPADAVIAGFGKVNGRYVAAFAEDYTVMRGTLAEYHAKKETVAMDLAKDQGWPFVGMNTSAGGRLQEGMDVLECYGWLFTSQIQASDNNIFTDLLHLKSDLSN